MEELIAKRYVKALKAVFNSEALVEVGAIFDTLAEEFKNIKYVQVMNNPDVAKSQKQEILLEAVKSAGSKELNNFIALLVEENRINIIPALSKVIKKEIAVITNSYNGIVYSNEVLDEATLKELSAGISKKIDSNISLSFVKSDFDGIKMEVADLGIEIDFSKSKINTQIIEHILKAI